MIAIVIDDMGLDRKRSSRVVGLPAPLTLAWLPYANDLPHQTKVARAAGHELMVHIPMEPQANDIDPGPDAMRVGIGNAELLRRLDQDLKSFDGYIGVNNHMGSRFTEDAVGMKVILGELQRRGLMFLDSRTTSHSVASGIARGMHLPALGRDVFLDDDMSPAAVRAEPCESGDRGAPPGLCDCYRTSPRCHRGCAGRVASDRGRQRLRAGSGQHHSEKSPAQRLIPVRLIHFRRIPNHQNAKWRIYNDCEVQSFRNDLRRLRPLRHQRDHRAQCRRQGRSRSAGRHRLGGR